jgi:hypothetical protein
MASRRRIIGGEEGRIEKKRLQWYGHIKRMSEESIPKLIMKLIPKERRKRGRPKKRGWKEYKQP